MKNLKQTAAASVAVALSALLPVLTFFFTSHSADELAASGLPTHVVSDAVPAFDADHVSPDVLWLARCAYSETKKPHEQELVAWVIRNRVETGYRGQHTYSGVVTDPYQFSAFNPGSSTRMLYTNLGPTSASAGWMRALEVAHDVYYAPATARPFDATTRHFYSERSMVGGAAPTWAVGHRPVRPAASRIDPRRFRFYSGVAAVVRL
ncbi:MAG TPA: cell wall hydrolase [Rubricoccaceae bacterium]|jgi:hypothetical protein